MDSELSSIAQSLQAASQIFTNISRRLKNYLLPKNLTDALNHIRASLEQVEKINQGLSLRQPIAANEIYSDPRSESQVPASSEDIEESRSSQSMYKGSGKKSVSDRDKKIKKNSSHSVKMERGPYRRYSREDKKNVTKMYKEGLNFSQISRILNIPSKNVIRWCRNGVERKPGAGRKVLDPEMQSTVYRWIIDQNKQGRFVTINQIRDKARKMTKVDEFQASLGWFKNFCSRYGISRQLYIH